MNYKRKKPRRQVKCSICTDSRIGGNTNNRFPKQAVRKEVEEAVLIHKNCILRRSDG